MENNISFDIAWLDIDFDVWKVACSSREAYAETHLYINRTDMVLFSKKLKRFLEESQNICSFVTESVKIVLKKIDTLGHYSADCYLVLGFPNCESNYHCYFRVFLEYGQIDTLSSQIFMRCEESNILDERTGTEN